MGVALQRRLLHSRVTLHAHFCPSPAGSLTESIQAVGMAKGAGWGVMTSHRCALRDALQTCC